MPGLRPTRRAFIQGSAASLPLLLSTRRFARAASGSRESYQLANGLRVHLVHNTSGVLAARVDVNYGAINETIAGTAHLFEHVAFGNTENYPEDRIRNLAARFHHIKPTVDLEWVSCVAQMLPDRLDEFLFYTADALFAPRFEPDHIRREKKSVLEEIAFRDVQSRSVKRMLYGSDHPLMYDYQGTEESIAEISSSDLSAFHAAGFHPNLMSIILVGELPPNTETLIDKYFCGPARQSVERQTPKPVPKLKKQRVIDQKVPTLRRGSTDIELIWNTGVTLTHADVYATLAMSHFLGGSVHYARLRQELGEKEPVSYAIGCHYDPGLYNSEMIVKAVTTQDPQEVTQAIFDVFELMRTVPVDKHLLPAFYDHWRYERRTLAQMNHTLRDVIFDEVRTGISAVNWERGHRSVTAKAIQKASRRDLPERSGNYLLIYSRGG